MDVPDVRLTDRHRFTHEPISAPQPFPFVELGAIAA